MGAVVDLVDKPFRPIHYQGVTDFDLIRVKLTPAYVGKVGVMYAALLGEGLTGRIGRLEIDTVIGDGIHVGAKCHDLVVEEGVIYVHDILPENAFVHWDAIQVMGGYRVTFRNLVVIQRSPTADEEGRCIFMSSGVPQGTPPDIEDVVFERCWFESHRDPISTKEKVVVIQSSVRSGLKDCVVCEAIPGRKPFFIRAPNAIDPVDSGNIIIPANRPVPLHP